MKIVLITGVFGQIGSFCAEIALSQNFCVYGVARPGSLVPYYFNHIIHDTNFKLLRGDVTDDNFLKTYISTIKPDYFINCAGVTNVTQSFNNPEYTKLATGDSVTKCLEQILQFSSDTHFVTLGSSELFGASPHPQNESTVMSPESPYGHAKLEAYKMVLHYRALGITASNAILFHAESERRSHQFLSKKVSNGAAMIAAKKQDKLMLGDISARRDFTFAKDSAEAIIKIVTSNECDDFVVSSNKDYAVQDFVERSFAFFDLDWKKYVEIDTNLFRKTTRNTYRGDNSKIQQKFGWEPTLTFDQLVERMAFYEHEKLKDYK